MSARLTFRTFAQRRKKLRKTFRKLVAESLETRLLFAVELNTDSVFQPEADVYSLQKINLPRIDVSFTPEQSQIEQMSQEHMDVFFNYGLQSIPLRRASWSSLSVSNPSIFTEGPRIENNIVRFRLAGKPGLVGSSSILVESGSTRQEVSVSLNNSHGAVSALDTPELWNREQYQRFAEGEGVLVRREV